MSRATARVAAMQMIYETCAGGQGGEETLQMVYDELREEETRHVRKEEPGLEDRAWIERVLAGVTGSLSFLDDKISAASRNWAIDRIARVDLSILRLAVWEIYNEDDVPGPVIINEAVELANCYSGDGSGRFVNGILGTILREKEALA